MADTTAPVPLRPLPALSPLTVPFWTSGADGRLRFLRCVACRRYHHPPGPVCPFCYTSDLGWEAVAGTGTVYSCTVNHHPWHPGWPERYVVAIVSIDEQDDLRLTTNVVGCPPEQVHIGCRVAVRFEPAEDLWLPLFELTGEARV